jgi:tRNA nucleotidyltransferase (CCA-adding enzyme)
MSYFPKVIPTGIDHGTVTVMVSGEGYEVTTLRCDGKYTDGRRPDEIKFATTIEEDLSRRDFTCNAIAADPLTKTIIDPFGGQKDINGKVLRAVGSPINRFKEDGLRIMRAARFAAMLGFEIEPETYFAMCDLDVLSVFSKVSVERIRDEWLKVMLANRPSIAFDIMFLTGMLKICCPELCEMYGCVQNQYHE